MEVFVCGCVFLTNAGSLLRQASVNSLKLLEKSPVSVGGGDLGMWKRTLIGCMSEFGGSPLASSIAVIPRDQMSACNTHKNIVKNQQVFQSIWQQRFFYTHQK